VLNVVGVLCPSAAENRTQFHPKSGYYAITSELFAKKAKIWDTKLKSHKKYNFVGFQFCVPF